MRNWMGVAVAVLAMTAVTAGAAFASTPGSVQVTLTSPKVFQSKGHSANITCGSSNGVYVAKFGRTTPNHVTFKGALTVRGYNGPGDYRGRLTVVAHAPGRTVAATVAGVKVSLTQDGGKSSFSRTLPGIIYPKLAGKVLAGTVTWTCAGS